MNVAIFDTETVGLEKCFCYDFAYCIADTETGETLLKKEFVVEQVWANKMLFSTAYYAEKEPLYIGKMRGRKAVLKKWGYAVAEMIRDFEYYEVQTAYAYNSTFDEKVFAFNADWFKTRNPLDNIKVYDIWGYTSELILKGYATDFIKFANENKFFTESGNISNNADTWGKFLNNTTEWNEEHTALADSEIEKEILFYCVANGLEFGNDLKPKKQIAPMEIEDKTLTIVQGEQTTTYTFKSKREYKSGGWKIVLK